LNTASDFAGWRRRTAWFIAGQSFSLFGSALVQYAIIWHITLTTRSGVMLAVSTICGFLPQILITLFSGVWADRYNRKRLIIFADALTALTTLALAVLFMTGHDDIRLLFAASALRAVGSGIQNPAVNAVLPQLVPQEQLTRVNGVNGSLQSLNMILAPAASGALLKAAPLQALFFVDVVTAAIAIGIMLFITVPSLAQTSAGGSYFSDLRQGVRYTVTHRVIGFLMLFYALFMFFVTPVAFLTPLQVTRRFGGDVSYLTVAEIVFSAGSVLGGLLIAAWGGFKNRVHTIALAYVLFGALTFALGTPVSLIPYMGLMGLCGLVMPLFNTPFVVLLQETVEPDMLGRVFGLVQMLASSGVPLGMIVFGPLSDRVSIEALLLATGVLIVLQGAVLFARPPR